jgi:hypothetical protein
MSRESTAVDSPRIEPGLEFVYEAIGRLGPPVEIGSTPTGESRVIPILSGPIEGPSICGKLFASGFDWQTTRPDGVTTIDAQYGLKTSDGTIIRVRNRGLRRAAQEGSSSAAQGGDASPIAQYFRCVPEFRAPAGRYEWLNESIFVCTATRLESSIKLWVYRVT